MPIHFSHILQLRQHFSNTVGLRVLCSDEFVVTFLLKIDVFVEYSTNIIYLLKKSTSINVHAQVKRFSGALFKFHSFIHLW